MKQKISRESDLLIFHLASKRERELAAGVTSKGTSCSLPDSVRR
jgi:hypothetical protein